MLQGKAKEEFFKWLKQSLNNEYNRIDEGIFNDLLPEFQNALCILWFDSVGIYIEIKSEYDLEDLDVINFWYKIIDNEKYIYCSVDFTTRTEATKKAIEKASEIFNQLNK